MVAAIRGPESGLVRLRQTRAVASVGHAEAAGMGGRSRNRERERNKISGKREQQQKSGGQALHAFEMTRSPKVGKV